MANARRAASASFTDPIQPRSSRDANPDPGDDAGAADARDVEPLDAAIARVLAELGGSADASINVYAIRPGSRSGEFVDSFPADAFAGEASFLKRIRDEFGAGEYRIQLRDGTRFLVNRLVRIAPARERSRADESAGVVAALAAVLEQQAKRTEDLIRSLAAARQPDSEDAVLARLKAMREIFGPIGGGARSGADSIEIFLRGLTLGRTLEPQSGAGTSDVLLETVKTLGPALVRAVEQNDQRIAGTQAGALASSSARVAPDRPPAIRHANSGAVPAEDSVSPAVRKLLEQLVDAAAREADPDLYAALMLDQLDVGSVRQLFAAGDPVVLLGNLEPRVLEHREWFNDLRTSLQELIADETASPVNGAAPGPGGRDDDAESHAHADT